MCLFVEDVPQLRLQSQLLCHIKCKRILTCRHSATTVAGFAMKTLVLHIVMALHRQQAKV